MKPALALQLGRISNLPTVWTNVLVGTLLTGAQPSSARLMLLMAAASAFYVGGMFLNDAFDRGFDAQHRPERPIPSGQVTAVEVFGWGFGLLALGLAGIGMASRGIDGAPAPAALAGAVLLGASIVFYDAWHKNNPLSPLVMGLCRVLLVLTAALAVGRRLDPPVLWAAGALFCHLIGLTYAAKQEHLDRLGSWWPLAFLAVPLAIGASLAIRQPLALLPLLLYAAMLWRALAWLKRRARGDVPRAVVTLIAGMCLLDASFLAGGGYLIAAALAVFAFALTLALQRWVSGT